jgi:acetyltransferase-like isoleucine patch superfamily enzyme
MAAEVGTRSGIEADEGLYLDYPPGRPVSRPLIIEPGARLRSGTVVYSGSRIGKGFETGHHVVIREESTIGDDVSIWSNTVVDYGVFIGDRVKLHSNCYVAQFSRIDDDAFLAPGVVLANDLFPGQAASALAMQGPHIGAGAHIGAGVTILPYVTIGAGALIGAGAVVTKDIPAGAVAYGCPAIPMGLVRDLDVETRLRAARASFGEARSSLGSAG